MKPPTPQGPRGNSRVRKLSAPDPTSYTPQYRWRSHRLHCEGVALESIAEQVGTPAYVYSAGSIADAYKSMDRGLSGVPHTICYSLKANSNLAILRLLANLGSGFDIVSGGELYCLERAGIPVVNVVFSGVGKSRPEIASALHAGIRLFNVESEAELDVLASEASRQGKRAPAAIRINPDVMAGGHPHISTGHHQHKFGMEWTDARRLYLQHRNSRWIEWQGISAHIGSQIVTMKPHLRASQRLAKCFIELARAGVSLRFIDVGGGLGVRYTGEEPMTKVEWGQALAEIVRPLKCSLLLEPGRSIVAPSGVLLTRVLYVKRSSGKTFVIVDAAMNDLLRPALYGATHAITRAIKPSKADARMELVDVVGPVCESGDCFVQDWPLGEVAEGDLLVLWTVGAYGYALSSNYNLRARPPEVLVEANNFRVIRRRESLNDLLRGE